MPNAKEVWTSYFYPFQIFHACLKEKPDILHIQFELNTFGSFFTSLLYFVLLLLFRFIPTKVVTTFHAAVPKESIDKGFVNQLIPFKFMNSEFLLKLVFTFLYKVVTRWSDITIVHSKGFKRKLTRSYHLQASSLISIPHGINASPQIPPATLLDPWAKELHGKKLILFFGTVAPRKGLEYLIPAFNKIRQIDPTFVLGIVGGFVSTYVRYLKTIQNLLIEQNLEKDVILAGEIPMDVVHAFLEAAEVVVFPYTYSISASGPLAFALEHRKPIVASNIGYFKEELKEGKYGTLVPIKNVQALIDGIMHITSELKKGVTRPKLSDLCNSHSWENIGKQHIDTYYALRK
jgi:glycosyltransferase involved in cell wall biosynthesis